MYYVEIKSSKENCKFYTEDIHGIEKCNMVISEGGIIIDEELWRYLLTLGSSKFIGIAEEREYTILDKELFEEVVQPIDTTLQPPTFNEQLVALGEQLTQEKLKNIQKDSTISQLGEELASVKLQLIQIQGGV